MRFGFKTANQYTGWPELLAVWREADEIEVFESGWLFDHLHPIVSPQATRRLRLGTLVTGIHHRHPAVLAKIAATTDIISEGRLEIGIGTGWNEAEDRAYGLGLGSPRQRSDRFEEACTVLVGLLSDEVTDFDGAYFHLQGAHCEPKPIQRPHPPLMIGGTGERRTLRMVARHAQVWDASGVGSAEEMEHKLEVLRGHCADLGRDPGEIEVSSQVWFDPATEELGGLAETAADLAARGVDLMIVYLAPPFDPAVLAPLAETLAATRS
jgi:alkanesulfonate monooxygenase SsuD/methylene tetrahydromethanopterin reductase-like flavin-dependent oxidoreductase (luciferase family)